MLPNIRWFPVTSIKGLKTEKVLIAVLLCDYPSKFVELGYWNGEKFVNQNKRSFKTEFTHFAILDMPAEPTQDGE